jgi:hypothetical protein
MCLEGRAYAESMSPVPSPGTVRDTARRNECPRVVIKLTYVPMLIGHMDTEALNIAGLLLALVGILLFFRYGMAHRVRTDGEFGVVNEAEPNTKERDDVLGWIGLILVVFATLVIPAFVR